MARDVCTDCEQDFPGGEGLIDGRCPSCYATFEEKEQFEGRPTSEPPAEGPRGFFGRRREEHPSPGEHPEGEQGD